MTTTDFFVGVLSDTPPEFQGSVPIFEDEYRRILQTCFHVDRFLKQQSFALVFRNYQLLTAMFDATRRHRVTADAEPIRALFFELQLAVLDWLLATRLFLDHTRHELLEKLGDASVG